MPQLHRRWLMVHELQISDLRLLRLCKAATLLSILFAGTCCHWAGYLTAEPGSHSFPGTAASVCRHPKGLSRAAGLLWFATHALCQLTCQGPTGGHPVQQLPGIAQLRRSVSHEWHITEQVLTCFGLQETCSSHTCAQPNLAPDSFCGPLIAYSARLDSNSALLGQVLKVMLSMDLLRPACSNECHENHHVEVTHNQEQKNISSLNPAQKPTITKPACCRHTFGVRASTLSEVLLRLAHFRAVQLEDSYASCLFNNWQFGLLLDDCRDTQLWTCADCEAAYKAWLCATVFPRCSDSPEDRVLTCRDTCFVRPGALWGAAADWHLAGPAYSCGAPAQMCSQTWLLVGLL